MERIVKKHGLRMKDGLDGFLVIYEPEKKRILEIAV